MSHISYADAAMKKKMDSLCQEIMMHETMEQKIWSPRLKSNPNLSGTINHLISEEKSWI